MMEEVVPTKCWNAIDAAKQRVEGDEDGQQLCVSLRSHVVQVRTERRSKELLRAVDSGDPDMKALAWAMFAKGVRPLKELEKRMQPSSRAILREGLCG